MSAFLQSGRSQAPKTADIRVRFRPIAVAYLLELRYDPAKREARMDWNAIGAIGEIIGALAVFLTLVYLALQIRQNTKAIQASAVDAGIGRLNDVRKSVYENGDLTRIYLQGIAQPADLDDESRVRFRLLLHNILLSISNIYSQTSYTGLSLSTWESQLIILERIINSPGGRWFWKDYRFEFEESFRKKVDEILSD
jgi:hypothetical protein